MYEINENGTYTIRQHGILLESGLFDESEEDEQDVSANRASQIRRRKKTVIQRPKVSAGAKKTTAKPAPTKVPVKKTTTSTGTKTYIGNTNVTPKTSSSSSSVSKPSANKTKTIGVYVRAKKVPVIEYIPDSDIYSNDIITATLKVRSRSTNKYYWYYIKIPKVINISYRISVDGRFFPKKLFETQTLYFDTQTQNWEGTPIKPANFRSAYADDDDEEEVYNGRNNLYYVRGSFETGDNSWSATDGWNNMTEIAENIFSCTLYLPQNIYGFKIGTNTWDHDFCVPLDYIGFVPKNEWFDVVKSYFSEWHGKNMALSTGGGLYTFSLDLTDENNPHLLISTDEADASSLDDDALYVVGDFNEWKFDENGLMQEISPGIWETNITISNDYEDSPCEFKISDKSWGGIIDEFGGTMNSIYENYWNTEIGGTYQWKGRVANLKYPFEYGKYRIMLDITQEQRKLYFEKIQ